jgi:hypothetical protein
MRGGEEAADQRPPPSGAIMLKVRQRSKRGQRSSSEHRSGPLLIHPGAPNFFSRAPVFLAGAPRAFLPRQRSAGRLRGV